MAAITKVAMIGAGSMGGGMTLLLAEKGISVGVQDPSSETVDALIKSGESQGIHDKIEKYEDYETLCNSLSSPRIIFFSLPHGSVGDTVVSGLHPYLSKGDIIVDCSNEEWENTQRRQGKLVAQGVYYIGCGVSGGYQAARRGPSMCPGGEDKALDIAMPLFEKMAAKDKKGNPCVAKIGMGGAGHYVKMIHNGIEHAMMSSISEAWTIMNKHMGMKYDEIGEVFEKWSSEGELVDTFLVKIGADICEQTDKNGHHVLADVQDKVVQDIDGSEGTGIWSNTQATSLHVPAPTLATAHFLRIVSAFRGHREHVKDTFHGSFLPSKIDFSSDDEKTAFIEDLRQAVYTTCLASYVQGMSIIDAADKDNKWAIKYANIVQIWKAGCIIQSEHINSLLETIYTPDSKSSSHDLLYQSSIAKELKTGFESLKKVVLKGVETNAIIPSMSATLDYLKYSGNLELPTSFYEAELDYFGKHMFDSKSDDKDPGQPETGKHHFEWKPA
ncbi:6-phosphogluconate dehydrogenase C-terminal [Glarea lozoyensis ATCC 20868]|uniref:6-phosphogluconate dehydrogenase, decarboxylating n=1 Tax=Glarea lozoyensis (strain ATCC 20868 / MF5171) TaxID=1116229 RepID=S3DVJ7_GLAL2|nr:6-phosphogluconate dehydrogenase C-terminal [Glarea lozoyensis ATCC 20868]EPE30413.1 6-phosphogluconate dehydrogenase C-terminal [Glarea lozoyensis ATCC 20868]